MTPLPPAELLIALRAKRQIMPVRGGASLSSDGKVTSYITDDGMRLINPNGPQAADTIERLEARVGEAEKTLRATEDGLRQICSGDEGPVILRGAGNKPVRCARRYEAKLLLRDLRKAANFLATKGAGNE